MDAHCQNVVGVAVVLGKTEDIIHVSIAKLALLNGFLFTRFRNFANKTFGRSVSS